MEHPSLIHWLWLLPLGLLALYLGSPRFLGTQASRRLRKWLRANLDNRRYTQLHDLHLSVAGRVEHYDHLVLGRSGIHVIDALYLPGDIKGTRVQAWWQRKRWGRTYSIANPVHENALRLQALQQSLGLPISSFLPSVALSGQRSLTTDAKDIVMDVSLVAKKINSQTRPLLSSEDLNATLLRIQDLQVKAPMLSPALSPVLSGRRRWRLLQLLAGLGFIGGIWLVYQAEIQQLYATAMQSAQPPATSLTDRDRRENSLICSYSVDTQRCACYQPNGEKAQVATDRCRALAERGSILQQ